MKIFIFALLAVAFSIQCRNKPSAATTITQPVAEKPGSGEKMDTSHSTGVDFSTGVELMTEDLIRYKVIDTSLSKLLGEACYCDTTVQINDSVFYAIISAGDLQGLCSHFWVVSVNASNRKVIASKYLYASCDVDYALNTYKLYDHKIVGTDKIEVDDITVIQKQIRVIGDEEANIARKTVKRSLVLIEQDGQIAVKEMNE